MIRLEKWDKQISSRGIRLRVVCGILPAMFIFSSSEALFSFHFFTPQSRKSNFLNGFFLSVTALVRVVSVLAHSSKAFEIFALLDFDLTSLNENDFCTLKLNFNLKYLKVKATHMCNECS